MEDEELAKKPKPPIQKFENEFILCFKLIADFLTFSCEQLFDFVNAIKSEEWRIEVLLTGLGRTWDFRNRDMVKHHAKSVNVSK